MTDPWTVTIDGLVEAEMQPDADDLISKIGGWKSGFTDIAVLRHGQWLYHGRGYRSQIWYS